MTAYITDTTTIHALADLGFAIEARGINADPVALLLLAHTARDLGVSDFLVSLMVNEDEPANARVRAFARVSSAVSLALVTDADTAPTKRELLHAC